MCKSFTQSNIELSRTVPAIIQIRFVQNQLLKHQLRPAHKERRIRDHRNMSCHHILQRLEMRVLIPTTSLWIWHYKYGTHQISLVLLKENYFTKNPYLTLQVKHQWIISTTRGLFMATKSTESGTASTSPWMILNKNWVFQINPYRVAEPKRHKIIFYNQITNLISYTWHSG